MPLFRVHFCADASEPIPLPAVEAEDPISAVEKLLADGRYPQTPGIKWARVAVTYHPDGSIRHLPAVPTIHGPRRRAPQCRIMCAMRPPNQPAIAPTPQ